MRNLRYQTLASLLIFVLSPALKAAEIYPFSDVKVTKGLTTEVEFDQKALKNYKESDNLNLRVIDGNEIIREDIISKKNNHWIWNKAIPFSENLKFVVLKNNKAISNEYFADTKSSWSYSITDSLSDITVRSVETWLDMEKQGNKRKFRVSIEVPKNCKGKILAIVFNAETKALLSQYYGEPKDDLKSDEIDYSDKLQTAIINDEGICIKQ